MTILVDPPKWPAHAMLWGHLVSDESLDELHAFAQGLGIPERGFDRDHYDFPESKLDDLVTAGAHLVSSHELMTRLIASGLRARKTRS